MSGQPPVKKRKPNPAGAAPRQTQSPVPLQRPLADRTFVAVEACAIFPSAVTGVVVDYTVATPDWGGLVCGQHLSWTHDLSLYTNVCSPDARSMALANLHESSIYLVDMDEGATQTKIHVLGSGEAGHLAWSPDGSQLAASTRSVCVTVWDTKTGALLHELAGTGQVMHIAWSPDGLRIAATFGRETIRVWDLKTGESRTSTSGLGVPSSCRRVAWSPDGTTLALAHSDHGTFLLDTTTMRIRMGPDITGYAGIFIEWSPDSKILAVRHSSCKVRLYCVRTHTVLKEFSHDKAVHCMAWSPDGASLAISSGESVVCVWSMKTHRRLAVLGGNLRPVVRMSWSPDSTRIIMIGCGGYTMIQKAYTRQFLNK